MSSHVSCYIESRAEDNWIVHLSWPELQQLVHHLLCSALWALRVSYFSEQTALAVTQCPFTGPHHIPTFEMQASRVTRIARGSGHAIPEVLALLEEHKRLAKMFQGGCTQVAPR